MECFNFIPGNKIASNGNIEVFAESENLGLGF